MYELTFTFRGNDITARMEIYDIGRFTMQYWLWSKDGTRKFVFEKEGMSKWSYISGDLSDELKNNILDALILRFDKDVVKVFWYKGERQIVEVSFPSGGGSWQVNINRYYIANIMYNPDTRQFRWSYHNQSWLKDRHMEYFIELIKKGDIESPENYNIK